MSPPDRAEVSLDCILFMAIAEKMEAKIRRMRLGGTRPVERVRSENGMQNRAGIVWFAKYLILRSRKRRNSGGSEGTVQAPPGYGPYAPHPIDFPFLIFDPSQGPEGRWAENESSRQKGGQQADG